MGVAWEWEGEVWEQGYTKVLQIKASGHTFNGQVLLDQVQ